MNGEKRLKEYWEWRRLNWMQESFWSTFWLSGPPAVCLLMCEFVNAHFDGSVSSSFLSVLEIHNNFFTLFRSDMLSHMQVYTHNATISTPRGCRADRDTICLSNQTAVDAYKSGLALKCVCYARLFTCCYLTMTDIFTATFSLTMAIF